MVETRCIDEIVRIDIKAGTAAPCPPPTVVGNSRPLAAIVQELAVAHSPAAARRRVQRRVGQHGRAGFLRPDDDGFLDLEA